MPPLSDSTEEQRPPMQTGQNLFEAGRTNAFDLPSIDFAFGILRLIGEAGYPLRLEAIANQTGLDAKVIRPLLDHMANAGFVAVLADGRFDLVGVALNLGASSRQTHQPSNIVSSVLQQLVADCSESA